MEVLISKDKEPCPVDHNVRGEYPAKDDDFLHEVEIVGLHTFQRPPLSLHEPLPPEDPGTVKPFPYPCHGPFEAKGRNFHFSVPALNQLRRIIQKKLLRLLYQKTTAMLL
ncbi:hypothetical protein DSO57_1016277 [Entomophthora muscae]|uniref:Uncharacterized protein n=1 Tax=Entomophthora muscae TaxID=34485 RepID=A0ACC2SHW4_9FUNG|nr:hypothetical protein DSO57_1016277 [Entomophthora muscae]